MTLLQQGIKERCESIGGSEMYYDRPIEVFPVAETQEITIPPIPIKMETDLKNKEVKSYEELSMLNSIELEKIIESRGLKFPEFSTREQLIELILSSP